MKNFLSVVLALSFISCFTGSALVNAKCVSENSGIYCGSIREAIQWTAQTENDSYVINRNYKELQPVTAKVQVHKTADSILTTGTAEKIFDFYPLDNVPSFVDTLIFINESGSQLYLDVIGRHPDYENCLQTTMWTADANGRKIEDLLSNPAELLCIADDNIILVTAPQ